MNNYYMDNKKILIIGGTGSLGHELTDRYHKNNELHLMSRDESKHWEMGLKYNNHKNINFIIGNIADKEKIRQTLIRYNFDIIILAAAMKHIDKCEYESNECINTNLIGTQNVLNEIENNITCLSNLKAVCFISTDKACSPVNIYGMTKASSECLMIEKSKFVKNVKFVCVRYGNVLNSRGSIIPALHNMGKNENVKSFTLTDERMTRFVMTLEQSVNLVEHAILNGESGDVVIPKLISCNIKDMLEIFSEIYNKPIILGKLRPGEKMLESLINETQSMRLEFAKDGYMHIKPPYKNLMTQHEVKDYNSTINPLSKEDLKNYLIKLNLIDDIEKKHFLDNLSNIDKKKYNETYPYPHCVIENALSNKMALTLQNEILSVHPDCWDRYDNPFEQKYTLRNKNEFPDNCKKLFEILTSQTTLNILSNLTGKKIYNDPTKNWWGIHIFKNGDYLDIHSDAGNHPVTKQKKHLTLGIYLSKDWKEENGGKLEVWDGDSVLNDDCKIYKCCNSTLPSFNKMILFTNTINAWHGSPEPTICGDNETRIFLTISYVSEDHENLMANNREKAFFVPRPNDLPNEEKDKLRFLRANPEKCKDVYKSNINDN